MLLLPPSKNFHRRLLAIALAASCYGLAGAAPLRVFLKEGPRDASRHIARVTLHLESGDNPVGILTATVKFPKDKLEFAGGRFVDKGGIEPKNLFLDRYTSDTVHVEVASKGGKAADGAIQTGPVAEMEFRYTGDAPGGALTLALDHEQGGLWDPEIKVDLTPRASVESSFTWSATPVAEPKRMIKSPPVYQSAPATTGNR